MNEAETLAEHIDPALKAAGWGVVEGSRIRREYSITLGRIEGSLFFAGDLGQRIFQQPFSWKSLGVDIRERSRTLHINYRTSHQIRMQADQLLGPEVSDVDGNKEERRGTVSVFNGPAPIRSRVRQRGSGNRGCMRLSVASGRVV